MRIQTGTCFRPVCAVCGVDLFGACVSSVKYEPWQGGDRQLGRCATKAGAALLFESGIFLQRFQGGEPDLPDCGEDGPQLTGRGAVPFLSKPPNAEPPAAPER